MGHFTDTLIVTRIAFVLFRHLLLLHAMRWHYTELVLLSRTDG